MECKASRVLAMAWHSADRLDRQTGLSVQDFQSIMKMGESLPCRSLSSHAMIMYPPCEFPSGREARPASWNAAKTS
eukprot:10148718-Lingulodinium_polyedra.AAC.1